MADSDFVKQMQDSLRQRQAQDELTTKKQLHDVEVIKTDGIKKWQALRESVMGTIKEINSGFSKQAITFTDGINTFTIRNQEDHRVMSPRFIPSSAIVTYQGSAQSGQFTPGIVGNELEYYWQGHSSSGIANAPVTIERMSEILITSIVNS